MSRQNRAGLPGPIPHSSSNGPTGPGVPGPVVQQAQQYLEENIKAWMQPSSSQSTSREDMVPLPLSHTASPAEPPSASHHTRQPSGGGLGLSAQGSITRQALQDHNLAFQQSPPVPPHATGHVPRAAPQPQPPPPPLTSPSSGYSDSYFALSLTADGCGAPTAASKAISFPHSLSFGGCSNHSLLQGTSYSSPCGNPNFGAAQPSAAASFFARAAQRLNLSTKKKRRAQHTSDSERPVFRTNFCEILKSHPPPIPPNLLRNTGRKETGGIGKVKVMLRMFPSNDVTSTDASYMSVDGRKKQVTLYDPTICGGTGPDHSGERHSSIAAPKMFAFDAVFSPDDNQAEVCSSSLCDVIASVVGGSDGCLFAYGHSKLGKTSTMVGNSNSPQELGVIPCAIWWLFRAINEHKHRTGARFSVRASAVEVSGKTEELRDLLADYAAGTEGSGSAPSVYLRDDPVFGTQLMNQSELRAPTAERAAFLLDAALAARTHDGDEDAKNAHFLFTLHVYQYRVEKGGRGGVAGGRSRLHLFDLGSCEKMSKSRDGGAGGCLSLSALGNVILALFNGQKHVPYKDSKLTQLLREAVGSVTCRAAMIAHVSTAPSRYPETLATLQLASRIHRLRRKKLKFLPNTDVSGEEKVCRPFVKIHAVGEDGGVKSGSSDPDYTSSSEQSCDTVIFVGTGRGTPLPNSSMSRQSTMSPLANEIRPSNSSPLPNKKQSSKSNHNQSAQPQNKPVIATTSSNAKEERSSDSPAKSAFIASEQSRLASIAGVSSSSSPKKKTPLSSSVASPKHQKLENAVNSNANVGHSPKMSKYVGLDYDSNKKSKLAAEVFAKSSPAKSTKSGSADPLQKIAPTLNSAPNSPQSLRKSKRSHKQDHGSPLNAPQPQSPANKPITKEPKLTSDETWIDGPRFVKPKFDSRTLHQLQKEKWVDGPGLYGYMDVQKETMIRKWVEDHSRVVTEGQHGAAKEVWIDFPPKGEDKNASSSSKSKNAPPTEDQLRAGSSNEDVRKESRTKIYIPSPNKIQVEVETHHYAKPNPPQHKQRSKDAVVNSAAKSKDDLENEVPELSNPVTNVNDNAVKGDTTADTYRYLESQTSDENSNSSVDLNDNDSDDLSNKLRCISEEADSTFTDGSIYFATCGNGGDQNTEDVNTCDMVDSSIQVTEEDIFSSCGWPLEMTQCQPIYGNLGDYDGAEHPLRVLSAEDLNLASSFTDSRAVSVDYDSMSVPETWTGVAEELDPDLTWRLLRGNSLSKYGLGRDAASKNINDNNSFKVMAKSETLNAKLERLSRLREIFEKKSSDREHCQPLRFPERLAELSSTENCFFMSNKFHHSADSSLEELRENDVNSIHSEPAELDVDKMDYQFNVKPMNGLRLEAFYNKICKFPRFPERTSQFGKPTQVVPPIVKQQKNYARFPISDLKSLKESLKNSREKLKEEKSISLSPSSIRKRWSASFRKPDGASDSEMNKHPSVTDLTTSKSSCTPEVSSPKSNCNTHINDCKQSPMVTTEQLKRRSLVEIIQEQRCQVYSEGSPPSTTSPSHHSSKHGCTHRASKSTKVITEHITNVVRNIEVTELRNDNSSHKKHQKKNGSPKLPVRGSSSNGNGRNGHSSRSSKNGHQQVTSKVNPSSTTPNSSPQHHAKSSDSSVHSQSGVSSSVSWTVMQTGRLVSAPYTNPMHSYTDGDNASLKSHILSRSTSTPTSPFLVDEDSWTNTDFVTKAGTYVRCTSTATPSVTTTLLTPSSNNVKKGSKWVARTSSSGHGSDSSALSADMKEAKELMGTLPKGQIQFSGTSSGYESMPRDSEGTPLSSSSHESSSEVGGKKDTRGRKGTRKKSQGSGKRSRSVPARPALTNSPSWQPLPTPVDSQPHVRGRGRLVRDLHDPSLWKSEEDVCCTSLLCCRLLDFY